MPKLRLAILGTRGIPARYGGFETFAEELSTRFVALGHEVTVYTRRSFFEKNSAPTNYRGVTLISLPTIRHKYLETIVHAFLSCLDLWRRNFNCVIICNAANSPFAWLARLRGLVVLINVDGVERKRQKWNFLGRTWYALGEICSVLFANRVIADAQVIADYYTERYSCPSEVIAYGASAKKIDTLTTLDKFKLCARKYILYVSRLEPENNALGVIEAFVGLKTDCVLVIVGDAPYAQAYKEKLREAANSRVVFCGFQFGDAYLELRKNCLFYVQATEVGGTHPALLEAMAYANCVIANNTPEHVEVLADTGLYYNKNNFLELRERMQYLLDNPQVISQFGERARSRVEEKYSWNKIINQYLHVISVLMGQEVKEIRIKG